MSWTRAVTMCGVGIVLALTACTQIIGLHTEYTSCSDGVKNGTETDVDCGGPSCGACAYGFACKAKADCATGACADSFCSPTPVGHWESTTAQGPAPRVSASITYDVVRGVTVLFGGRVGATDSNETWLWDGTGWTQAMPSTIPKVRSAAGIAFDSMRGVTVLFGGLQGSFTVLGDTWEWDGNDWATSSPAQAPPARRGASLAFAADHARTVLVGGVDTGMGVTYNDAWEWDGMAWTVQAQTALPKARSLTAFAFDPRTGKTLLFGGAVGGAPTDETWLWDGARFTQATPSASPDSRYLGAAMLDTARRRVVLAGGLSSATSRIKDTWEWDGATWVQTARISPDASSAGTAAFTYDSARHRGVYYDGTNVSEYYALGVPCKRDGDCGSGHCRDRVCCATATCDACQKCNSVDTPGSCAGACN